MTDSAFFQPGSSGNKPPWYLRLLGMGKPYFFKTPAWLKKMYPGRIWNMSGNEKKIYLTFDDGPHPTGTAFILDTLKKYNAKATFFCIGRNVEAYPQLYQRILEEGHVTGNHTQSHLNGYKTPDDQYITDTEKAFGVIQSNLFRPPYGRIRSSQVRKMKQYRIIMWDVLSGDFDPTLSKENCLRQVLQKTGNGSIVVFHDSEKGWEKMSYCLPQILEKFSKSGFEFASIT